MGGIMVAGPRANATLTFGDVHEMMQPKQTATINIITIITIDDQEVTGKRALPQLIHSTYLAHQDCGEGADDKAIGIWVEANHPIQYDIEQDGCYQEEGQFGKLLGHKVEVNAVHVVLLLSQKDGDLGAEDVGHRHHVDEGKRYQAHEEHFVDVLGHNSIDCFDLKICLAQGLIA